MGENPEDLNYDFNYNQFLGKTLTQNLRSAQDKQRVFRWLRKLSQSNRNVNEMKLRNEFMFHLLQNLQAGELHPPFKDPPPAGPLPVFSQMLPGGLEGMQGSPASFRGQVDGKWGAGETTQRPLLYKNSPDGGAFLAAQPIPKCGAFCYMAVIAKPKD
ncbi:hypothetical protein GE061_006712 [Apolygus lucorum]|uniref:DUF4485 domain-containing protein n=2 Tax=Mirini TaxID=236659 RepID=A0A8S9WNB4_APOLU|nr:hypothetical protein GE061_020307 [Apolygus lucorum]KAF6200409.1 hypothetical protein GE061_006712 [Apolygus lucorum]